MTTQFIAIDLDGTLLHHDNTISDYSVAVLQQVAQLGHHIILTTGRPYRMAIDHYHRLNLESPLITFNGALTTIPSRQDWDGTHGVTIDKSYLIDMVKHIDTFQLDFIASEYRDSVSITNPHQVDPKLLGLEKITKELLLDPTNIQQNPYGILIKTSANDKELLAQNMRDYFQNQIDINTWGGPMNILEVSSKGINKGYALKRLLNHFGYSNKALIAFGDEKNDITMLQLAGKSFAMKNANPKLLPFADEQLHFTNEEDGVAKTLEALFL